MKKVLFTLLMFAGMFSAQAAKYVKAEPCTVSVCVNISGKVGNKKKNCTGLGLGCLHLQLGYELSRFAPTTGDNANIEFTVISGSKLGIAFYSNETGLFEMPEDIVFPDKLAALLGFRSLVVTKGQYSTTKRADGAYYVVVNTVTK